MLLKWFASNINDPVPLSVNDALYIVQHPGYSDFSEALKNWAWATLAVQLEAEIKRLERQ